MSGNSITRASASPVSVGAVRKIEAHRLPASVARNLPASVAAALSFRAMAPEYETQPALGLDLVSITITGGLSGNDLAAALVVVEQSLKPSGPADCLQATARLRAVARMRPTITSDERLALAVYGDRLAKYPADAVALACEKWIETSPFWPGVSELLRMVEWALQPRRELVLALARAQREAAHG
jgi:hypothetical protein